MAYLRVRLIRQCLRYLLLAAKNFRFSYLHAHRHIIFADTSGLFNDDRFINVLNFISVVPSKIPVQISGKQTDFKTEIQNIFRTKTRENKSSSRDHMFQLRDLSTS